ncbi:MAG: HAMP domain-containing protein [Deltaproteobacteria bacterium]|nr:HAMP domain-containing protein [Deltaproteobacteria bacterium]MBT8467835.1 HAMP domain-containing protein [Deltaproteobacteria bacterium]
MKSSDPQIQSKVAAEARPKRVIARRLAISFALVSVVAVAMCGMLIALIGQVSGLVAHMQTGETAIRESLVFATSVREQYIHQAHWIIEQDPHHLKHYEEWVEGVRRGGEALQALVPESERWRVAQVIEDSRALDKIFKDFLVPAMNRGDRASVVKYHKQADELSQRATKQADFVARSVEQTMAMHHTSATRMTRAGLLTGATCVFLVLSLSVVFTIRLRRAVLNPLEVLSSAARRFGSGDFESRVGPVGEGELRAVATAFDRMAEELEAREQRLIESERMAAIGQLAAGVAHEVNNPIQVIRGYLKTMTPDTPFEVLEEELRILDEEASACQRIAEDLVAFARAPELLRDHVEMKQLLCESVRRFGETPDASSQAVHLTAEPGEALVDGGRLRQVILNLLVNAAHFSEPDQPIEITGRRVGEQGYHIAISDTGPGIALEDRAKIFEPFFTKRSGGSGLGLAVCMSIVRAHGGTLSAVNNSDRGATFHVRIPGSTLESKEGEK